MVPNALFFYFNRELFFTVGALIEISTIFSFVSEYLELSNQFTRLIAPWPSPAQVRSGGDGKSSLIPLDAKFSEMSSVFQSRAVRATDVQFSLRSSGNSSRAL